MSRHTQSSVGSPFGARSTASDILASQSLHGQNIIVTGGYSGIGLETVRALASAGGRVTVPARRPDQARICLEPLDGDIEIAPMDLADLRSVVRFTEHYLDTGRALHLLINNAGIMACPLNRIGPGWESQFGINHLGHMALTQRLLPALQRAEGARLVALSSTAHIRSDVNWQDPHYQTRAYDKLEAYAQAKSANALFALGADQKWSRYGLAAFSVHPGGIFTPLHRHLALEEMVALGWKNADGSVPPMIADLFKSPEQGAATTVWAASSALLDGHGGVYCEDCDIAPLAGADSQRWEHAREWICDEDRAERLWYMSEAMLSEA